MNKHETEETSPPATQPPVNTENATAATDTPSTHVEYPQLRLKLGEDPVHATCPYCRIAMTTQLKERVGPFTLLTAVYLAHCLLCCLPFILGPFRDVDHICSNCNSTIGRYKRM